MVGDRLFRSMRSVQLEYSRAVSRARIDERIGVDPLEQVDGFGIGIGSEGGHGTAANTGAEPIP